MEWHRVMRVRSGVFDYWIKWTHVIGSAYTNQGAKLKNPARFTSCDLVILAGGQKMGFHPNGKDQVESWRERAGEIHLQHSQKYQTGPVTRADAGMFHGHATCHPRDRFNSNIGQRVSLRDAINQAGGAVPRWARKEIWERWAKNQS